MHRPTSPLQLPFSAVFNFRRDVHAVKQIYLNSVPVMPEFERFVSGRLSLPRVAFATFFFSPIPAILRLSSFLTLYCWCDSQCVTMLLLWGEATSVVNTLPALLELQLSRFCTKCCLNTSTAYTWTFWPGQQLVHTQILPGLGLSQRTQFSTMFGCNSDFVLFSRTR